MIALIDCDLVAYRCSASCKEGDGPEIANIRAHRLMADIMESLNVDDYRAFLSGTRNFREQLFPEYKANRRDMKRPEHLQSCKEFLIQEWGASVSDGIEADDDIGIEWAKYPEETIIVSLDKDFKQFYGQHYNFVKGEVSYVSEVEANRFFYQQVLLGDKSDNIPGFDGKARTKPTLFITSIYEELENLKDPADMYKLCLSVYEDAGRTQEDLELTANLLYLWRTNPDKWVNPLG